MNMIVSMIIVALIGIVTNNSVGESGRAVDKTIQIAAKKFEFTPGEITAKKGEPVVLEIKSEDVNHGFSLPDFGVRGDVKSGSVLRLSFTPNKTGQFTFTCDVFCGSGHEDMAGTLNVTE